MITNSSPFSAADDANVLYRKNSKEQVFISAIIPVLVIHYCRAAYTKPSGSAAAGGVSGVGEGDEVQVVVTSDRDC
jgi:hypothetical protein